MSTVKAKIPTHADYAPILPLAVPDLKEIQAFQQSNRRIWGRQEGSNLFSIELRLIQLTI